MASVIQTKTGNGASPLSVTFDSNLASGNIVIACCMDNNAPETFTISGSQQNDFTSQIANEANSRHAEIFTAIAKSGAQTVTLTRAGSNFLELDLIEVNGISGTASAVASGAITGTAYSLPSTTFTGTPFLLASFANGANQPYTAGTGFTLFSGVDGSYTNEYTGSGITSPTTFPMTATGTGAGAGAGVVFPAVAAAAAVFWASSSKRLARSGRRTR